VDLKYTLLEKLKKGEYIFTDPLELAKTHPKIAIGVETEFGYSTNGDQDVRLKDVWRQTGGRMYSDCSSIPEYSTPECSLAEIVPHVLAGYELMYQEMQCQENVTDIRLFARNRGWNTSDSSASNGTHLCISTPKVEKPDAFKKMCPFFVSMILLNGTGCVKVNGKFFVSQRAEVIKNVVGSTQGDRGIISARELGQTDNSRVHILHCDSNMIQSSSFLTLAPTVLVFELMKEGRLPDIEFREEGVINDLHTLSESSARWLSGDIESNYLEQWKLKSLLRPRSAVDVLWEYFNKAQASFKGRDLATDLALIMWEDTLEKLRDLPRHFDLLKRRLDWVNKLAYLKNVKEVNIECTRDRTYEDILRAFDLEYHLVSPNSPIYCFEEGNLVERIFSPAIVDNAMERGPFHTRGGFRSWLVRVLREKNKVIGKDIHLTDVGMWGSRRVVCGEKEIQLCPNDAPDPESKQSKASSAISNPLCSYVELIPLIEKSLAQLRL